MRCRRWLALPFAGEIPDLFGFDPLPAAILAASVAIVITYVATTEALVFYRRLAKRT
ncbi:MAG: hypothetical protein WA717_00680 [Methyloceanibacter sp.]